MNPLDYVQVIVAGGASTAIATQLLKNYVPVDFQRYPRLTAAGVSLVAGAIALYVNGYAFVLTSIGDFLTASALILLVAAATYKFILKQSGDTTL